MVESTKNLGGAPEGNRNAEKGAVMTAMLRAALNANDRQALRDGVTEIARAFAAGERWALEFAFDRIEGKSAQSLKVSGDEDNPLHVTQGLSATVIGLLGEITAARESASTPPPGAD